MDSTADPRRIFADWLTTKENPFFARAMVNRIWAEHFGKGLVDPVDDFRESPTLKLMDILERNKCRVDYHDTFIPQFPGDHHFPKLKPRKSRPLNQKTVGEADAVLICTDHTNVDYRALARWADVIVDTRNVLPAGGKNIFRA
jgi:UDP-N-acetyl-D-mannosaminuronate dehydrogenase